MPYAIIPTPNLVNLSTVYRFINQISKNAGTELEPDLVILPFLLLEDKFTADQKDEITANGGTVFSDLSDYQQWSANYQLT
jgi:hypothetical protein